MSDLDHLRAELARIDREFLELVGRRQRVSARVRALKRATRRPVRDFRQEKTVIERARAAAGELGFPPQLAEDLVLALIRSSLEVQERGSVTAAATGGGKRALVIGGSGKMGGWFARFLASQGFDVETADPDGGDHPDEKQRGFPHRPEEQDRSGTAKETADEDGTTSHAIGQLSPHDGCQHGPEPVDPETSGRKAGTEAEVLTKVEGQKNEQERATTVDQHPQTQCVHGSREFPVLSQHRIRVPFSVLTTRSSDAEPGSGTTRRTRKLRKAAYPAQPLSRNGRHGRV